MLVFIHINKTGGRTIRYILRSSFGLRHCEVEPWHARWSGPPFSTHDLQRLLKIYPHLDSIAGHRITGYVDFKLNNTSFNYFTFMRDPLKTCASRFQYNVQYRKKKDLVFEDWIKNEWTQNHQTSMIAGESDVNLAHSIIKKKDIFVGLTERFDESLILMKSLIIDDLNISYARVNVASDNSIARNLISSKKTRQLLIEANQADLELYDLITNEIYPRYQQEYGPSLQDKVLQYQQTRINKFNNINIALSRSKQYMVYKPLLYLHRKGIQYL